MEKTGVDVNDQDIIRMMQELKLKNPNRLDFREFCIVLDCNFYAATNLCDIPPPAFMESNKGK